MIIERRAGYLNFQLEQFDFLHNWKRFIADLKEQIRLSDRDWNEATQWWSIKDIGYNAERIQSLKKKYLEDENQEELDL